MNVAAVTRTEEKKAHQPHAAPAAPASVSPAASFGAAAGLPLFLQAKLSVRADGDSYEREADYVASVAAAPSQAGIRASPARVSRISVAPSAWAGASVQRKCAGCSGGGTPCAECAEEDEEATPVQAKALSGRLHAGPEDGDEPSPFDGQGRVGGAPLPPQVRDRIEPILGADLGDVRVHTGPAAWRATSALQARAFTHGREIWLGERESASDIELMAHESTHVVQQTGGRPPAARSMPPPSRGASLAPGHASVLSAAYGLDVGGVRIHTDSELPRRYGKDAVAIGDDVAFAPGAYLPGTRAGDMLIAHELAHVAQQRGGSMPGGVGPVARTTRGLEREAHHAARSAVAGAPRPALSPAPPGRPQGGVISFVEDVGSDIGSGISHAASSAYHAGARAVHGAVHLAERGARYAADWVADRFWDIVRSIYAPAETYLRHPSKLWDLIIHGVMDGVSGLLGGVFHAFGSQGIFGALGGLFKRLFGAAKTLVAGLASGACGPLAKALNSAVTSLLEMTDAVLGPVKAVFGTIAGGIAKVVKFIGGGIIDILKTVGGAVWDAVSSLVGWISKIFGKVKSAIGRVWSWVKRHLGFSTDDSSTGGVWDWIKEKASKAWDAVKRTLLGWVEPLKTVGAVLLALSPIGPLYLAFRYGPRLVHWIREIWRVVSDPHTLVAIREYVAHRVLPAAMAFLLEVAGVFNGIAHGIATALQAVSKPLADLAAAFDATRILALVSRAVRWFAGLVTDAVSWVAAHIGPFFDAIAGFFHKLWSWLKPILDVLLKIISLANPVGIVMLIGSWVWLHIPDCIKLPIIRFILDFLIKIVDALPDVALFGPLWPLMKYGMLGFLRRLRGTGAQPDEAERALDRIARLVGGTADFVLGLVVGILEGLWDGLIGPFQLVYMIIDGVGRIIDWFESVQQRVGDRLRSLIASVRGLAHTVVASFWPTVRGLLSGSGGGDPMGTVLGLLGRLWSAVTGAATRVGGAVAGALIGFIMLGDYALGSKLGYVAGLVLFEVVLAILTAGVSAELEFFQRGIGYVLRLLVRANEAIGEVFGAIMKVIPGVEGAITRLIETLGDLPVLRRLIGELRRVFGEVETLALGGLRRLGGEATAETTGLAVSAGARVEARGAALAPTDTSLTSAAARTDETALAGAGTRADTGAAARADREALSHADTPAARDAAVRDTERVESASLTQTQLDDELEHLADHPELMRGEPPHRTAELGEHTWTEHDGGRWCRASGNPVCTTAPMELSPPRPISEGLDDVGRQYRQELADDRELAERYLSLRKSAAQSPATAQAELATLTRDLEDARLMRTLETNAPHKIEQLDRIRELELAGRREEARALRQQLEADLRRLEGAEVPAAATVDTTTSTQRAAEIKAPGDEIHAQGAAPTESTVGSEAAARERAAQGREFGEKGFVDRAHHDIGVEGGRARAHQDGLTPESWVNPRGHIGGYGQGFDDIMRDANGNLVIIEYKGNESALKGAQMTREWVSERIDQIAPSNPTLAQELRQALDNGTLTGRVYRTPIFEGRPLPTIMDPPDPIRYAPSVHATAT